MMKLRELCEEIFPGSLVEIKEYRGIGIWPYILDKKGDIIDNKEIAQKLQKYGGSEEFGRAIAALRGCLKTFLE